MDETLVEAPFDAPPEVDIAAKLQGVLVEELSPLQSTLKETHKNVEGLSSRFNEMEIILNTLCKTVDILQGQVKYDDRPKTAGDEMLGRDTRPGFSNHEQAMVSQLVARIEHLSADVTNFDTARQLREDNLLLRKDLQAYQDRERHFRNRMDSLEKKLTDIQERSYRPRSGQRSRRGTSCGEASPEQVDFPPIDSGHRSKSSTDLTRSSSRGPAKERTGRSAKQKSDESDAENDQFASLVRPPLVSPSRTKKAVSILRRGSSSSNSSVENGSTVQRTKPQPITAKFNMDSLQSEIQISRSDNSILRQDIQVYRHRENQLYRRTLELEDTITQQNSTIMALSPRGHKDEHKSEVNLNIDFVTGDTPVATKAIVTAIDNRSESSKVDPVDAAKQPPAKGPAKPMPPLPPKGPSQDKKSKGPSRDSSQDKKSKGPSRDSSLDKKSKGPPRDTSKGKKSSSSSSDSEKKSSSSDEDNKKAAEIKEVKVESKAKESAPLPPKSNTGKPQAVKTETPANVKLPPANGVPKTKPNNNNKTNNLAKPTNGKTTGKEDKSKSVTIVEPEAVEKKVEQVAGLANNWQNAIMEGEDWRVTISSKHELETVSDFPHKVVTITPKTPPPKEVEKKVAEKKQVVEKTKTKEKKIKFEKKVSDCRSDPIPKPPQYPCARPPRGYIPGRPIPNASPGVTRSMEALSSYGSSSNIAVVSPLPMTHGTITFPTSGRASAFGYDDECESIQMYIKQEPQEYDVDSAPPSLQTLPIQICNVSYDSIYDDPFDF